MHAVIYGQYMGIKWGQKIMIMTLLRVETHFQLQLLTYMHACMKYKDVKDFVRGNPYDLYQTLASYSLGFT